MPESIYQVDLVTGQGTSAAPKTIAEPKQTGPAVQPETQKPSPKEMTLPQPKQPKQAVTPKTPPSPGYDQTKQADQQDQEALNNWIAYHQGLVDAAHRVKVRQTAIKIGSNTNNPQAGSQNGNADVTSQYFGRVEFCIGNNVTFPMMDEGLETTADFRFLNNGFQSKIVKSSGNPRFDAAVSAAIRKCAGPPPPGFDYSQIDEAKIHQ